MTDVLKLDDLWTTEDEEQGAHLRKRTDAMILDKFEELYIDELKLIEQTIHFVSNPENNAVGLAAPQVGSSYSWFVMKLDRTGQVMAVINPDILGRTGRKQHIETCFSEELPAQVKRSRDITVNYVQLGLALADDVNKDTTEAVWTLNPVLRENISGRDAQVFQHELHHLQGKLLSEVGKVIRND